MRQSVIICFCLLLLMLVCPGQDCAFAVTESSKAGIESETEPPADVESKPQENVIQQDEASTTEEHSVPQSESSKPEEHSQDEESKTKEHAKQNDEQVQSSDAESDNKDENSPPMGPTDPDHGTIPQNTERSYKTEFMEAARSFIQQTNAGGGLSAKHFSIGDPEHMLRRVQQWVDAVYIRSAPGGDSGVPGRTEPNVCATAIIFGFTNGGIVEVQKNPTDDPATAFHEAIHVSDFSTGGDGIKDSECYATHYFDNRARHLVRKMREQIDSDFQRVSKLIKKKSTTAPEEKEKFVQQLKLIQRQVNEMRQDTGWNAALAATGAKFDIEGYMDDAYAAFRIAEDTAQEDTNVSGRIEGVWRDNLFGNLIRFTNIGAGITGTWVKLRPVEINAGYKIGETCFKLAATGNKFKGQYLHMKQSQPSKYVNGHWVKVPPIDLWTDVELTQIKEDQLEPAILNLCPTLMRYSP